MIVCYVVEACSLILPYSLETRILIEPGSRPIAGPYLCPLFLSAGVTDACMAMPDLLGCWVLMQVFMLEYQALLSTESSLQACSLMTQQPWVAG